MPPRKRLRAVSPTDAPEPAPRKPLTLAEAIESGSYLEILTAQRREAVRDVRDMTGPAKAAMHRQISLLSKEIAALTAEAEQEAREAGDGVEADDEPFSAEAL